MASRTRRHGWYAIDMLARHENKGVAPGERPIGERIIEVFLKSKKKFDRERADLRIQLHDDHIEVQCVDGTVTVHPESPGIVLIRPSYWH